MFSKVTMFVSLAALFAVGMVFASIAPAKAQSGGSCCESCRNCSDCPGDCTEGCPCCTDGSCCASAAKTDAAADPFAACCDLKSAPAKSGRSISKSGGLVALAKTVRRSAVADASQPANLSGGCCSLCEADAESCVCSCEPNCAECAAGTCEDCDCVCCQSN